MEIVSRSRDVLPPATYCLSAVVFLHSLFAPQAFADAASRHPKPAQTSAIVLADQQPGATADAKLNNCIAALPANGGICDARGFGATTQTIAATVNVGSNRGSGKSVTLLLDRTTEFLCTITDNTPCLVRNAGSTIQAEGTIAVPNGGVILSPTAVVSNALLTVDDIARNFVGGDVEGLTVLGNRGATVSDALCGVQNALQITHFKNLACSSSGLSNAVILKVYCTSGNGCGNIEFDNIEIDGLSGPGNRPVWIGCALSGSLAPVSCPGIGNISFNGPSAIVHSGAGLPIITIEAQNGSGGTNPVGGIGFYGTQLESHSSGDIGILDDGAESLHVYGLSGSCSDVCGTDLIELAQPRGTALDGVDIRGVDNQTGWTNTLSNTVNGAVYSWSAGFARLNYTYGYTTRQENAGANIPIVASLSSTAELSDTVKLIGMTSRGHCTLTPTDAAAAANMGTTYISAKSADQVTISHAPVARMTYDLACTPN